jgi:hypothetical protein
MYTLSKTPAPSLLQEDQLIACITSQTNCSSCTMQDICRRCTCVSSSWPKLTVGSTEGGEALHASHPCIVELQCTKIEGCQCEGLRVEEGRGGHSLVVCMSVCVCVRVTSMERQHSQQPGQSRHQEEQCRASECEITALSCSLSLPKMYTPCSRPLTTASGCSSLHDYLLKYGCRGLHNSALMKWCSSLYSYLLKCGAGACTTLL